MRRHTVIFETYKIFSFLIAKYLLAFVFLLLTQILFWVANSSLFSVSSGVDALKIILGNIHFGISTVAIILLPYFVLNVLPLSCRWSKPYKRVSEVLYSILVILMMLANMVDIPYFQWTFRRTTGDVFKYLGVGGDMSNLVPQFLADFWVYVVLFVVLIILFFFFSKRIVLLPRKFSHNSYRIFKDIILSVLFSAMVVLAIRGGLIFQYRPLAPIDASRYASSDNTPLVVNTPFSVIRTFSKQSTLERINYFTSPRTLETTFSPISLPLAVSDSTSVVDTMKKTNIMVIMLESFSEEYIGFLNPTEKSFTPFLDSLAQKSVVYQGMANGKRSIESMPSLLAGIPTFMDEPYITSSYSMNKIEGLPQILKRHNYHTSFFHGAYNGSMNFDAFLKSIGVDNYYGMNEYDQKGDYDGNWGIFDEPFLQFVARKMSEFPQPFFTGVFTLSSHHPYTIPEQHKNRFMKGELPILETVMYTDYALKLFFERASKTSWYNNTLFVITSDHTAQSLKDSYGNNVGMYKIPMILFKPDADTSFISNHIFQQIDLVPTIIDYLQLNDKSFGFGKSVYQTEHGYHIAYRNGAYQLLKDNYLLVLTGDKFEVYDVKNDPMLTQNIEAKSKANDTVEKNKKFLKAIIQQYNNRLIDNKFVLEEDAIENHLGHSTYEF